MLLRFGWLSGTALEFVLINTLMKLIDNKTTTLRDDLLTVIQDGGKIAIAASCFSIYAFQELKQRLKSIDELRFKLADKKQQKATNVQIVELEPVLVLDRSTSFRHGYRNVVVLKKMTFPGDKVLSIELSEKQISGRTIAMTIDYEDVLAADSFDTLLLKEE